MKVVVFVALAACGKSGESGVMDREAAKGVFEEVKIDAPPGMSDLSIDDRGVLWAIAERDRHVVEIDLSGQAPRVTSHPLDGIAHGIDTEAIAWLGNNRFAIGTEGASEPTASIMFAELRGNEMMVTSTKQLTSGELGVTLDVNHGIEAVCGTADELLAATESVGKLDDGTRYSALIRLRGDAMTIAKVRLTTKVGKLSALYCTFDAEGTADVIALERHFSVTRILHFAVKRDDVEVTPTVELDLAPILHDSLNLEGIVRLPDGRLAAINDNQSKVARGPTELLLFMKR
ncbi:MAG TPA: esterase-like activity of phytase family protein [Kofleriaceae bacterium]